MKIFPCTSCKRKNIPTVINMLKAFHFANYIFVTLKFLCNTFWSMSQQVLQHNQRIVRGPPILVVKFKESVLESFHSIQSSFIRRLTCRWQASITITTKKVTCILKKKKEPEKPFVQNLYYSQIII